MALCLLMWTYEQTQPPAFFSRVAESWSNIDNTYSTPLPLGAPTPRSLRQTRRDGGPPYTPQTCCRQTGACSGSSVQERQPPEHSIIEVVSSVQERQPPEHSIIEVVSRKKLAKNFPLSFSLYAFHVPQSWEVYKTSHQALG